MIFALRDVNSFTIENGHSVNQTELKGRLLGRKIRTYYIQICTRACLTKIFVTLLIALYAIVYLPKLGDILALCYIKIST